MSRAFDVALRFGTLANGFPVKILEEVKSDILLIFKEGDYGGRRKSRFLRKSFQRPGWDKVGLTSCGYSGDDKLAS